MRGVWVGVGRSEEEAGGASASLSWVNERTFLGGKMEMISYMWLCGANVEVIGRFCGPDRVYVNGVVVVSECVQ